MNPDTECGILNLFFILIIRCSSILFFNIYSNRWKELSKNTLKIFRYLKKEVRIWGTFIDIITKNRLFEAHIIFNQRYVCLICFLYTLFIYSFFSFLYTLSIYSFYVCKKGRKFGPTFLLSTTSQLLSTLLLLDVLNWPQYLPFPENNVSEFSWETLTIRSIYLCYAFFFANANF